MDQLQTFDIRTVNTAMIQHISDLYLNDQYMTVGWIRRESSFSLYLFMWVSTILEYIGIAEKLRALGL